MSAMGGRLAADSMEWLYTQPANSRPKLHHLILAAPDVRVNQFTRALPGMKGQSNRITLYASEWDQALRWSESYHGSSARVGQGGSNIVMVNVGVRFDARRAHLFDSSSGAALRF